MRILKKENNGIVKAQIISSAPAGFEDVTDLVINPEKMDEVALEHLTLQTIPAIEEVQAQAAYWTNGEEVLYNSDDIPTIEDADGNAILDPAYTKVAAVAYVAPEPMKYRLVKKAGTDELIATKNVSQIVKAAIEFGNSLLVEFSTENILLGITQDGMTKTVRQAMTEIILALQTGSLYDAIDEIDLIPAESKDGKYITDARLQEYKQKIQDYLGA